MVRRSKKTMQVVCYRGETTLSSQFVDAEYIYRDWFIRINPKFLFPAWRKEHRKIIKVNGRKVGWAEIRSGWLPLDKYDVKGKGLRVLLAKFVRKKLGLMLRPYETGYIAVSVGHFKYAVTQAFTEAGFTTCEVFDIDTQEPIGRFSFTQDFSEVYASVNKEGVANTLQVIMGYVADTVVYSSAAMGLNKTINIKFM